MSEALEMWVYREEGHYGWNMEGCPKLLKCGYIEKNEMISWTEKITNVEVYLGGWKSG